MALDLLDKKVRKILILTSSGGGGLIQAAFAKEQECLAQDPGVQIVKKDVLIDWNGKWFGKACSHLWNRSQIHGNVSFLKFLSQMQLVFDWFSWPNFFFRTLAILFKERVDRIIDTQPMGTSAIVKAIRIYNWLKKSQLYLEKILVDLPTKKATHFFRSIKWLTRADRAIFRLVTIAPLLEEGQTAEEFWQLNCRCSEKDVFYEDVYVRQAFRKWQHQKRLSPTLLFIRYKQLEELRLIQKSIGKSRVSFQVQEEALFLSIPESARVITILLGSQPAIEATLNYVKTFIRLAKEKTTPKIPIYLFVFCADHDPTRPSLLQKICKYLSHMKEYPTHLTIVPFSFQKDDVIASLFHRSDLSCTRSGGQTLMELMCVSSGEIWIHSETKKEVHLRHTLSTEELLDGIASWEAANAVYMQKLWNAKIVTPETFAPLGRKFLKRINSKMTKSTGD